jgi:hypothetical protein
MRWHTSSASSSADIVADLFRLIRPNERAAFREMLEHELSGRELPDGELRRVAERAWHRFLKHGWQALGRGSRYGCQLLRFQGRGSSRRKAFRASVDTNHEVSAPPKADDEGKNVGMGAALCSQSAAHKT